MNIIILAENYPHPSHPETQAFIHSRSVYYQKCGLSFEVISFRAEVSYEIDGIRVHPPSFVNKLEQIDLCISHAPNLRNHLRLLRKKKSKIKNILFVFHGYEALKTYHRSISPSVLLPKLFLKFLANSIYDFVKLPLLKLYIAELKKSLNVFAFVVSKSLLEDMKVDMKVSENEISPFKIINNPINPIFNSKSYKYSGTDDILCIRNLDDRKYGADLFVELARKNPDRSFHLYGKGTSFDNVTLPANLKIFKQYFKAEEMIDLLCCYRAAVLFTRWDSQGILACEFAAFGIPLLTSDLPICKEMLAPYSNVGFVSNNLTFDLESELSRLSPPQNKVIRFTYEETTALEVAEINQLLGGL